MLWDRAIKVPIFFYYIDCNMYDLKIHVCLALTSGTCLKVVWGKEGISQNHKRSKGGGHIKLGATPTTTSEKKKKKILKQGDLLYDKERKIIKERKKDNGVCWRRDI